MSKDDFEVYDCKKHGFLPRGVVLDCGSFLDIAYDFYRSMGYEKFFDYNAQKLVSQDFSNQVSLGKKLSKNKFIGVKIAVGTQEELKEAFK